MNQNTHTKMYGYFDFGTFVNILPNVITIKNQGLFNGVNGFINI